MLNFFCHFSNNIIIDDEPEAEDNQPLDLNKWQNHICARGHRRTDRQVQNQQTALQLVQGSPRGVGEIGVKAQAAHHPS